MYRFFLPIPEDAFRGRNYRFCILCMPSRLYLSVCLPVCLSACLPASLKTQQFCETSSIFELDNVKNKTILRDLLSFWTWQHQKRNNAARHPQFSKLTTSKTKQFCETSFKIRKLSAELTASYHRVLRFFQSTCLKCLPQKIDLSRKIILANRHIWCSQMQPLSGNQRPDLLTCLMNMSFVLRLPRKMHLCRSCSNVPRLPSFLEMPQNPHVLLTFNKVHNPLRLPRKQHLNVQKWSEPLVFFYILTFDFEMCFAPQRRALFEHLNFQKSSNIQK